MENKDLKDKDSYLIRESFHAVFMGIVLMIFVFLFVHYVLDIKAFA